MAQKIYRIMNWLVIIGVAMQFFFVGMTVVARQMDWEAHTAVGHILFLPILIMVITVFAAKGTRELKRRTVILLVIYLIQADGIIMLRHMTDSVPALVVAAFHPVLALGIATLSATLLRETAGGKGFESAKA
jgi:hypothetical protein